MKGKASISTPTVDCAANTDRQSTSTRERPSRLRAFFEFCAELRRRRVCRAAATYSIVFWLICQVIETIGPELELPEWTLTFFVVLGLVGLPIVLTFSWLVDITPDGLVVEHDFDGNDSSERKPTVRRGIDYAIDGSLVIAALLLGSQLMAAIIVDDAIEEIEPLKIAILPFQFSHGDESESIAHSLVAELQHELATAGGAVVIIAEEPYLSDGCIRLAGNVSVDDTHVRVTATIVDNETGAITWTQVFQRARDDLLTLPAQFAHDIALSLPEFPTSDTKKSGDAGSDADRPPSHREADVRATEAISADRRI